ncbi:hypothetical protein QVD17_16409 [Tagetes erecta]|uniref:Uncharacterized protein n=1 Tax=Tagetes erecta TaxID=13708 RepID=A0AAD8KV48_TARER|nr:hypothetical protein QVD17_16409 [Tagetes erecta]
MKVCMVDRQVANDVRLEFCGGGVRFWWWFSVVVVVVFGKLSVHKKRKAMADKPLSVTTVDLYVGDSNGTEGGGPYDGYGDDDGDLNCGSGYGDDDDGSYRF